MITIHPFALLSLLTAACFVGIAGTILYWSRDMDNIRFTTTRKPE